MLLILVGLRDSLLKLNTDWDFCKLTLLLLKILLFPICTAYYWSSSNLSFEDSNLLTRFLLPFWFLILSILEIDFSGLNFVVAVVYWILFFVFRNIYDFKFLSLLGLWLNILENYLSSDIWEICLNLVSSFMSGFILLIGCSYIVYFVSSWFLCYLLSFKFC